MIKKQYPKLWNHDEDSYFKKFIRSCESEADMQQTLANYKASLGKGKRCEMLNVKWRDAQLYALFVLRWS